MGFLTGTIHQMKLSTKQVLRGAINGKKDCVEVARRLKNVVLQVCCCPVQAVHQGNERLSRLRPRHNQINRRRLSLPPTSRRQRHPRHRRLSSKRRGRQAGKARTKSGTRRLWWRLRRCWPTSSRQSHRQLRLGCSFSLYLSIYLYIYLYVYLSYCQSIHLSLSINLSIYLFLSLSLTLYLSLPFFI